MDLTGRFTGILAVYKECLDNIMKTTTAHIKVCEDEKYNYPKYLTMIGEPISGWRLIYKRFFDIIIGILGLIVAFPFILIFGILVKTTSKGPVFYTQERVGLMGSNFKLVKLRSMRQNAEEDTGAVWASENDPRVTTVGKIMRRTRIDELPQFWNVLIGNMSFIGPRPERQVLTEKFSRKFPDFPKRLRTKPGITGYAQVNGGYDINPGEKCRLDNIYIDNFSVRLEVKIFFSTILVICTGSGAR